MNDQEEVVFTSDDYEPGEIIVFGTKPPIAPDAALVVLDLDGDPLFSENRMYRRQVQIPNPIPVLAAGPGELVVTLPGGRQIDVASRQFIHRNGYVERLDCSGTQVPDNQPETSLSFRWYGEVGENGWLGVTVVDDIVRGTLVTDEQSYQLSGTLEEGYRLLEIDPAELPTAHGNELFRQFEKFVGARSNHGLRIGGSESLPNIAAKSRSTGPVQLDLLIMYTSEAENDAGGSAGLDALIQQSIDNTNQALINSDYADLSVREVHRELLTGFVPSGPNPEDGQDDLDQLRINSQILAARDAHHADITIVMLRDVFNDLGDPELAFCGIAYLQSPTCGSPGEYPDCGVGLDFENYAITWVSTQCATLPDRNSFPHEIGHLMGGEHQPGSASQDPPDSSFVWSYAHFRSTGSRFGTVMWIPTSPVQIPQQLNFSNPDVLIAGGQPSGIANQRDNIRTFEALAPTMEQFRVPPPELIFADSFESP